MSERISSAPSQSAPQQPDQALQQASLQEQVVAAQKELERYQALAALPLSREAAHWVNDQVRSARAVVQLGMKALRHEQAQQQNPEDEHDPYVLSLLGLSPPSPPTPPTPSDDQPQSLSTRTAISGLKTSTPPRT
jgi:hypothetical protein